MFDIHASKDLYARGYLITKDITVSPFKHWDTLEKDNFFIHYDHRLDVQLIEVGSYWVIGLGSFFDHVNNIGSKREILTTLLEKYMASEAQLFEYLDQIAGRHLVFYGNADSGSLLADATGMRSVFYSSTSFCIGSHAKLVAEITSAKKADAVETSWLSKYTGYYLPGHYTPYENIFFLTPNTLLDAFDLTIRRFYPRANLPNYNIEESVSLVSQWVERQLEHLSKNNKLLMSLSAGIDSRTTLALTKKYTDSFKYFTYYKTNTERNSSVKSLETDQIVVKDMTDNLRLNHDFVEIDYNSETEELQQITKHLSKNTFGKHGFRLAKLYKDNFSEYLHIRSNILEIGRYFYRKAYKIPKDLTIDGMITCYSSKALEDEKVRNAFSNYYKATQLDNIYNYDPYDMLYWEYRMGTWHTQLLLESDVAHDTYILFNSRKILERLLSLSGQDRKSNRIFNDLITYNWPVLNYWKINNTATLSDFYDSQIDSVGRNLENTICKGYNTASEESVPYHFVKKVNKVKFYIDKPAPEKNDTAEVEIPLILNEEESYNVLVHLRSPYENPKNKGRLKYEVLFNGTLLLEEDIAYWKETNLINLAVRPSQKENMLQVRVTAIKNCENWGWGKSGTLIVERVTYRKSKEILSDKMEVTCTSPYSKTSK